MSSDVTAVLAGAACNNQLALDNNGLPLATIPGQVPSLAEMPSGCRFAGRCPHAWARCRDEAPGWSDLGGGHRAR